MRVLIDAQLPKRLSLFLSSHNIDSKHTLDLPKQNSTPDEEINEIVARENRIVISKDSDFLDSYILEGKPDKLLIVSTGNINNDELIDIFGQNIDTLKSLFKTNNVVEIDREEIQVHY